jgi:hypothetical protein
MVVRSLEALFTVRLLFSMLRDRELAGALTLGCLLFILRSPLSRAAELVLSGVMILVVSMILVG